MASLKEHVEALATMDRRSASAGERESAAWCAERLREAGAAEVEIEPYRYQHTFGHVQAAHFAAAATGRVAAALALLSFELDYSGRSQLARKLFPEGEGANVIARVPGRGNVHRTLVLVAHHDAAHTGLMWDPRLAGGGSREGHHSFALLPEVAMAAMALGPGRLRTPARAVLAVAAALSLQVTRGATVPGASDNATGVAAVIDLVRRFGADPLHHTDVIAVLPGSEEAGMGGMAAWLAGARLHPASTLVLGLDTLGAGEPIVCSSEGPLWRVDYRDQDLALADAGARRAGREAPRRFRIGGWTDPVLARLAGLPAISMLSLRGNAFNDYHLPSDSPENVDWDSVEDCRAIAEATAREWAER